MENIKRRIEFFSLYDHTNIEKHLEKMVVLGFGGVGDYHRIKRWWFGDLECRRGDCDIDRAEATG